MIQLRFTPSVLSLALLSAYNPASAAAPAAMQLEPVVVTATRTEQPLAKRLSDVTVITAEDIARSGQSTLIRLLQQQHGVEVTTAGGPQTSSSVFIRGANSGQTLCLVDGLRTGSVTLGQPTFNGIPLSQIERIEILRGPASSLYGADAIGGVVNIITKKGGGPLRLNADLGVGRWTTAHGSLGFTGSAGAFTYALQTGYEHSDGYNSIANSDNSNYDPDIDGYSRKSISGRLGWDWAENHSLGLQMLSSHLNSQYDQPYTDWVSGAKTYRDDRTRLKMSTLDLSSVNRFNHGWTSRAHLGQSTDDGTADTYYGSHIVSKQRQFGWQNELTLNEHHALTLGYEHLHEKVRSTSYTAAGTPDGRRTNSVLGVYQLRYAPFSLQTNLRADDNSQYGNETTGALLLGWQLDDALRLTGQYGTGFKAPSFNDLYWPYYGNTDIRPESSENREIGAYFKQGGVNASLVAYRNRVEDLIVYDAGCTRYGPGLGCAANVNRARLEGLSLSYRHTIDDTTLTLNGDWQNPTDEATGRLLPRRAKRHGLFALNQTLGRWIVGSEFEASSRRYDDAGNKKALAGYGLWNVHASYQAAPAWRVVARWNNLLDKDYEMAKDYQTPESNLFVAIQYQQQ